MTNRDQVSVPLPAELRAFVRRLVNARDSWSWGVNANSSAPGEALAIELEQLVHLCRHDPQWRIVWRTK